MERNNLLLVTAMGLLPLYAASLWSADSAALTYSGASEPSMVAVTRLKKPPRVEHVIPQCIDEVQGLEKKLFRLRLEALKADSLKESVQQGIDGIANRIFSLKLGEPGRTRTIRNLEKQILDLLRIVCAPPATPASDGIDEPNASFFDVLLKVSNLGENCITALTKIRGLRNLPLGYEGNHSERKKDLQILRSVRWILSVMVQKLFEITAYLRDETLPLDKHLPHYASLQGITYELDRMLETPCILYLLNAPPERPRHLDEYVLWDYQGMGKTHATGVKKPAHKKRRKKD